MSHTRTAPNTKARSLSPPEEDKASGLGCLPPPSPHLLSVGACDEGVLRENNLSIWYVVGTNEDTSKPDDFCAADQRPHHNGQYYTGERGQQVGYERQ